MSAIEKSPDAFRTISEVADWLGVPTHVLRFWESRFAQVKPVKRAGGRRYYRPTDMELLGGIKRLLHDDGMTIRGVQKLLRDKGVRHVAGLSQPLYPDVEDAELVEDAVRDAAEDAATPDPEPMVDEDDAPTGTHAEPETETETELPAPTDADDNAAAKPEVEAPEADLGDDTSSVDATDAKPAADATLEERAIFPEDNGEPEETEPTRQGDLVDLMAPPAAEPATVSPGEPSDETSEDQQEATPVPDEASAAAELMPDGPADTPSPDSDATDVPLTAVGDEVEEPDMPDDTAKSTPTPIVAPDIPDDPADDDVDDLGPSVAARLRTIDRSVLAGHRDDLAPVADRLRALRARLDQQDSA